MRLVFDFEEFHRVGGTDLSVFWKPAEIIHVDYMGVCTAIFEDSRPSYGHYLDSTLPWYTIRVSTAFLAKGEVHVACDCGYEEIVRVPTRKKYSEICRNHIREEHIHGSVRYRELEYYV
jgi:hypothetical protein